MRGDKKRKTKVLVSLPVDLLERLDEFARASYRTRSAEMAVRLGESMAGESIDVHGVIVRRVAAAHK